MSYTVLARRYRSTDFDEIVGQEPISRTLRNAIASDRTAHAYLFCGTRGVGKTSMARIFAKALNATDDLAERASIAEAILRGDDLDVIEIDGASNRGIQEARDLIAGSGLSPARCLYKIYIIDEVHMLTREAFNALLKTMEEPPAHVKFILCTTDPHKVPATIQSRCQRFDFRTIPTRLIAEQLDRILEQEGVEADGAVVSLVARMGNGSMRDALSLLDRLIASGERALTMAEAETVLGLPDHSLVDAMIDAIVAADPAAALQAGAEGIARGMTVERAIELLTDGLRALLVLATCGADTDLVELSAEARETAQGQAAHFDANAIVYMIAVCDAAARSTRGSATARAVFDATLVRLCLSEQLADVQALLRGGKAPARAAGQKKRAVARPAPEPAPGFAPTSAPASAPASVPASVPAPDDDRRVMVEPKRGSAPPAVTNDSEPIASAPSVGEPIASEPDTVAEEPESLWKRVQAGARAQGKDEAKLAHMVFRAFDGRVLRLGIAPEGRSRASFLQTQVDVLAELVERTTGRAVRVVIEADADDAPGAPAQGPSSEANVVERRSEAVKSPVVQRAMDLFEGVVTRVEDAEGARDV